MLFSIILSLRCNFVLYNVAVVVDVVIVVDVVDVVVVVGDDNDVEMKRR